MQVMPQKCKGDTRSGSMDAGREAAFGLSLPKPLGTTSPHTHCLCPLSTNFSTTYLSILTSFSSNQSYSLSFQKYNIALFYPEDKRRYSVGKEYNNNLQLSIPLHHIPTLILLSKLFRYSGPF